MDTKITIDQTISILKKAYKLSDIFGEWAIDFENTPLNTITLRDKDGMGLFGTYSLEGALLTEDKEGIARIRLTDTAVAFPPIQDEFKILLVAKTTNLL